ncbi:hypothetical protein TcWFU_003919 [Taenia crassiceps]|uniref:Uncharacterized protein n=1 Tax=Taenia crassiceps TaxID=6207 RepID=A0ABR4QL33_9CEST
MSRRRSRSLGSERTARSRLASGHKTASAVRLESEMRAVRRATQMRTDKGERRRSRRLAQGNAKNFRGNSAGTRGTRRSARLCTTASVRVLTVSTSSSTKSVNCGHNADYKGMRSITIPVRIVAYVDDIKVDA